MISLHSSLTFLLFSHQLCKMSSSERPWMEYIPRARLTTQFLESNASTHESVFGAIAEIVDNAYDSGSNKLEIDIAEPDNDSCGSYYILLRDAG